MEAEATSSPPAPGPRPPTALWLAALPLLAVALGGSTERWAQGALLLAIGMLAVVAPPRRLPGYWLPPLLAALWLWSWSGFLPAWLQGSTGWRQLLTRLETPLAGTVSPQPWITLEAIVLLTAGIVWLLTAAPFVAERVARSRILRLYLAGAGLLAAAAVYAWLSGTYLASNDWEPVFGFFDNRNQMANWMACTGVLAAGLILEPFRKGEHKSPLLPAGVMVLMLAGLLLVGSRAGIGLFFGGLLLLGLGWMVISRGQKRLPWLALGTSAVALMLAALFLFGGKVMERLATTSPHSLQGRWQLQLAGLRQAADMPLTGAGLGNFGDVFTFYRERLVSESRAVHPESDWAWLAGELGWPGLLLAMGATAAALWLCWPLDKRSQRVPRLAAAPASLAFLAHSFLDVSTHRLGTWLPAALLLAAAWHPRRLIPALAWQREGIRLLGLGLVVAGAVWMAQHTGGFSAPGLVAYHRHLAASEATAHRHDWAATQAEAEAALAIRPLDWRTHLLHATALTAQGREQPATLAFQRMRWLEQDSPFPLEAEALAWAAAGQTGRAAAAYNLYLQRSLITPENRFDGVSAALGRLPGGDKEILMLATTRPAFLARYLSVRKKRGQLDPAMRLLESQPGLADGISPVQQVRILDRLANAFGVERTLAWVRENPAWENAARWLQARQAAAAGRWEEAFAIGIKAIPEPIIPNLPAPGGLSAGELETKLMLQPGDWLDSLQVIQAYRDEGKDRDALRVIEALQKKLPDPPVQLLYLKSRLLMRMGKAEEAWLHLEEYRKLARPPK